MKAFIPLLALAASAFGADLAKRWPVTTTTEIYYTTTTGMSSSSCLYPNMSLTNRGLPIHPSNWAQVGLADL
jgi:hypothetical protein